VDRFETLCAKWELDEILEAWQGFSVPRDQGLAAVNGIRAIFEAAASREP